MIAILEAKRAGLLGKAHWANNLLAGLVVGVVALPLAMAFAIASGAKPEQGIYTAIVAGTAISLFGGSRVQIGGPTGAFIVILSGITAQYGIAGLQMATLMAGFILVGMGFARLGLIIKFIPEPVIVGFTSGIGVIIWVSQWKDFFGLSPNGHAEHFVENLGLLAEALPQFHFATTAMAIFSLLILVISPRILKRVPSPLLALVAATILQATFQFEGVATIGSAFGGISQTLPSFELPSLTYSDAVSLVGPAFAIAMLGAIESLLSAVVADGMAGTRHDSNQELIGQGIANIASPLFGGFAATGAIARTATNIRNGGTSPLAGLVHALTLLLVILLAAPLAAYIPLCVLSAILWLVAWNMSGLHHFIYLVRSSPRADMALLLITFVLTVVTDLVVAVNAGVVLASLLFMQRMSQAVQIEAHSEADVASELSANGKSSLARNTAVYSIDGPFFFGAAEKLEQTLRSIQQHVETVVIRMGRVPFMDATGLQAMRELVVDFQRHGTRVVLCEVKPNVLAKLQRSGLVEVIGNANIIDSLADLQ
jgi:SulP family sulfate permease